MRNNKWLILAIIILPWLTFPFLGRKNIKHFWPGALFMSLFLMVEGFVAQQRKWWWFYQSLKPNVLGLVPLTVGPFFIGSIWILRYTYGRFWLYLVVNFIVDSFFVYILLNWFTRIRYASLIEMKKYQLSFCFFIKSLLMYGCQVLVDKNR